MSVTGLEHLVAVEAPKVLTAVAKKILTTVVPKVARHGAFRIQVYLKVRRSTRLHPPARLYLRWLRDAAKAELHEPLEAVGAQLALTLDGILSTNWKWRLRAHRRSDALRLVEATYPAILALVTPQESRALEEDWARHRHETLLAAFSSANALEGFDRADVATLLLRESRSRRMDRLRSFSLDDEQVAGLADLMERIYSEVRTSPVVTLVGPFGAGKTEQAESWFARTVVDYRDTDGAPLPMWFHASALATTAVDDAVRARLQQRDGDLKVAIVIDGLDEVDPDLASQIARQTRVLIATHSASSALMTVRPGVLPADDSDVPCHGLSDHEAETVINLVAGDTVRTWGWNEDLRESVSRPFFAIAVGRAHRDGISVHGQAGLIRHLVERALEDPATRKSAVQHREVYSLLEQLAIHLTETGSKDDGLSYAERQQALRSRLVREVNGRAEFTLPIFQQWFAAQALLADPGRIDEIVADPVRFSQWRWALAVAGSATNASGLDDLLQRCIRGNPGAGAWVQKEIASGHRSWRDPEEAPLDAAEAKSRLLLAARAWVDGFGRLAPAIYPIRNASDPITLGVGVQGSRVSLGWSSEVSDEDRVVELPHDVHPFLPAKEPWQPDRSGLVANGDAWPWQMILDRAENGLRGALRGVLGPLDGVWRDERRHQLVRELTETQSITFPPVNRDHARDIVAAILKEIPDPANARLTLRNKDLAHGSELLDLHDWLCAYPREEITRPLATSDVLNSSSGWVWDMYSPAQLQTFTVEMLGRACDAYDEAATFWFPTFGWSLGTGEPGKFGVLSELIHYEEGSASTGPGMSVIVVPLPVLKEEVGRQDAPFVESSNGRAAVMTTRAKSSQAEGFLYSRITEWWRESSTRFDSRSPFATVTISRSTPDMVHHERPASEVAVDWLWNDLNRLGIVSGGAPEIR